MRSETKEFNSNELGDWLAAERCRQNLSRAKLCEKTGYSSKALYNIECGKVKTSVKLFEDFAAALGYSCSIVIKKLGENSR